MDLNKQKANYLLYSTLSNDGGVFPKHKFSNILVALIAGDALLALASRDSEARS